MPPSPSLATHFVPGCRAEVRCQRCRIDVQALGRRVFTTDQRCGQAVRVGDVVEAKAALHTQALLVGRAVYAINPGDFVILDLEGQLTADATVRADGLDFAVVVLAVAHFVVIQRLGWHECAGWAGLNTLATGDTSGLTHGVVEVEGDLGIVPPARQADDVVDLHFAAGADAEVTLDAGVEVDAHGNVAVVEQGHAAFFKRREAAFAHALDVGHVPEMRGLVMCFIALGLIGNQQLHDHLAGFVRAVRGCFDDHAFAWLTDTGRRQRALAVDLDHTGAAVAV